MELQPFSRQVLSDIVMTEPDQRAGLAENSDTGAAKSETDDLYATVPSRTENAGIIAKFRLRPARIIGLGAALSALIVGIAVYFAGHFSSPGKLDIIRQERLSANADHFALAMAVAACSKTFDLGKQPKFISQLLLGIGPNGDHFALGNEEPDSGTYAWSVGSDGNPTTERNLDAELAPSNFQRAAIYLSDAIARARVEFATNRISKYFWMSLLQITLVVIGAITTILISIKSISHPNTNATSGPYFAIGIAAIIFSSLGTAVAALNSFYHPRELYLESDRSLLALRQLHSDVVAYVTSNADLEHRDKCLAINLKDRDDPKRKQLQRWTDRFGVIVAGIGSSAGQSSSRSGEPEAIDAGTSPPPPPAK
jgi:hypothetical protein